MFDQKTFESKVVFEINQGERTYEIFYTFTLQNCFSSSSKSLSFTPLLGEYYNFTYKQKFKYQEKI